MAAQSVEQRLDALERELADIRREVSEQHPGVIGRTRSDFLDTMFGVHAGSAAFPEVMRAIEAERERERQEALRSLPDDATAA